MQVKVKVKERKIYQSCAFRKTQWKEAMRFSEMFCNLAHIQYLEYILYSDLLRHMFIEREYTWERSINIDIAMTTNIEKLEKPH